jgi:ribosomal protein S18 acetylase RimI-like enzyme
MTLELRPSTTLEPAALAALFTAAYEGYVLPMQITEDQLRSMVDAFDIRLDASRVASVDGDDVGLANLAVRDEEAWIGGVGVVPSARRRGIAEALMLAAHDVARGLGVRRVWLEVIEENESAYRLYEKLGYDVARHVEVWSLPQEDGEAAAREIDAAAARERIGALRTSREPWQRADATLDHYDDLRGLEARGGAAVFRRAGGTLSLLQLAGDAAEELLQTLHAEAPVSMLNLPADDPAAAAFRTLGGHVIVRQREMSLDLT